MTKITDALGKETDLAYDDAGNLTSRTDPLDNETTWTYDEQNRVVSMTDPLNPHNQLCLRPERQLDVGH